MKKPKSHASATAPLIARLRELMRTKKTNAVKIAEGAGLGKTAIYDILNGKNKNPAYPLLRSIAAHLQVSVSYLTGETDRADAAIHRRVEAIPIIGTAEAGAFRKMSEVGYELEHDLPTVDAPRSTHFPSARHFGTKIRGDSMNAAKPFPLVDGMYALCVDMTDAGLAVESGRIYLVRKTLDNGQTWELTIKRAQRFRDRIEFRPESTNPSHETITVPLSRGDEMNSKQIEAIGLVYGGFGSVE